MTNDNCGRDIGTGLAVFDSRLLWIMIIVQSDRALEAFPQRRIFLVTFPCHKGEGTLKTWKVRESGW